MWVVYCSAQKYVNLSEYIYDVTLMLPKSCWTIFIGWFLWDFGKKILKNSFFCKYSEPVNICHFPYKYYFSFLENVCYLQKFEFRKISKISKISIGFL